MITTKATSDRDGGCDSRNASGRINAVFNRAAVGYDREALRFFAFAADRLVVHAGIRPGQKVLDVATGTGAVAIAAAQIVGPAGRVVAIDMAEQMLDRAQAKIEQFGIANVDLHLMDAEHLEFRAGYFDVVLCAHALDLMSDMEAAIHDWVRVLKPGGTIAFSGFGAGAFEPMAGLLLRRIENREGSDADQAIAPVLHSLAVPGRCQLLLHSAGLKDSQVTEEQLGYHLRDAYEWWEVVINSGFCDLVDRADPAQVEVIHNDHLLEVSPLADDAGLWLDVPTLFALGRKP